MTFPNRLVFDVETTIVDGDPSVFGGAEPVLIGVLRDGGHPCAYYGKALGVGAETILGDVDSDILVAHNIAFDLHHLWCKVNWDVVQEFVSKGHGIWDTQIAEYVLSGQQSRMTSLNDLALKYGGELKDSTVTDMFNDGIGADKIDQDLLREYLSGDLKNTDLVFRNQWVAAANAGQTALILAMGRARLCTAMMQYHGIAVDVAAMTTARSNLEARKSELETKLAGYVKAKLHEAVPLAVGEWHLPYEDSELVTDQWLGWYLFGGQAVFDYKVPKGEFKSGAKKGTPRYERCTAYANLAISRFAPDATKSSTRFSHIFPMDDDVLSGVDLEVAREILELRRVKKLIGTYIDGILKNTKTLRGFPAVHPNFNHALTATGRLSCSNPNLQNQDEFSKEFFIQDKPLTGNFVFMEFDFKQLEVCALAQLSHDSQLIRDLSDGVDLHFETGKTVFGWRTPEDMDDKTRRGVKGVNFGLIYGGSARGLAKTTGFPVITVEQLIKAFYARYPRVKEWQEGNRQLVSDRREYDGETRTARGVPAGKGYLNSPCGRKYVFTEYDAHDWLHATGTFTSFSPTEIKNYPVQGFATGDIVPLALAVLIDLWAEQRGRAWSPRLTVHDSMMLCVPKGYEADVYAMMRDKLLPRLTAVLKEVFDVDLLVPLVLDCKVGDRWSTLTKYKP